MTLTLITSVLSFANTNIVINEYGHRVLNDGKIIYDYNNIEVVNDEVSVTCSSGRKNIFSYSNTKGCALNYANEKCEEKYDSCEEVESHTYFTGDPSDFYDFKYTRVTVKGISH